MRFTSLPTSLFVRQRKRLVQALKPNSVAVVHANDIMPTGADGTMRFRQNSDLYYLTGVQQEETILLLCPNFPDRKYREILFLRETNEIIAQWEGHKLTKEEAREATGIDTIVWLADFPKLFHHIMVMGGVQQVYLNTNEHYRAEIAVETRDARFIEWCKKNYPLHTYERLAVSLAKCRSVKQKEEQSLMQRACNITEAGFRRALSVIAPGKMEYEIEAEFLYEFVKSGSRGFAYEPIVASGKNSCVLHYLANDQPLKAGDLVLLDVGAEYGGYNADMTRTVPVSGKFSPRQKAVYNAVLRVMRAATNMLRPGVKYFEYHKEVQKLIASELLQLKLITKEDIKKQNPSKPAFQQYFMHGTSHQLGIDIHDVGDMYAPMQEGQVWTVEPGIYIPKENFGIRIENNVVITKTKPLDLMKNIPIEAEEIEALMRK